MSRHRPETDACRIDPERCVRVKVVEHVIDIDVWLAGRGRALALSFLAVSAIRADRTEQYAVAPDT